MNQSSALEQALAMQSPLILDGGLATELEDAGHDLDHPLWSARMLLEKGIAVSAAHTQFLKAGADIITTVGYQATFQNLEALGHTQVEAAKIMLQAVELACRTRAIFLKKKPLAKVRPLVAASIGPYGAFLADGSEYRGNYGISRPRLRHFHQRRFQLLAASDADLLACETIPSFAEAEVLAKMASQTSKPKTWLSFSCRDERHISDGTPFELCASLVEESPGVVALGVNCTAPQHILSLVRCAKAAGLTKPLIVYPNSGEKFDPLRKMWSGTAEVAGFAEMAAEWVRHGADVVGGCCRVRPDHIRALRKRLVNQG